MIKSEEISVIVQGAIDKKITKKCLKSIRKYLPKSEIILSTWIGENIENLAYDKLMLNPDVGAEIQNFAIKKYNNTNRQLFSTKQALNSATKKYILKLRTDCILKGVNFLDFWNQFNKREQEFKIFKHRVIISSLYSRICSENENCAVPMPFHPSDCYLFGLKEDIQDYFDDTKLATKKELGNWTFKFPNRLPYPNTLFRYSPEQYFCFNWVKKHYKNIQFYDWTDWNIQNIELSKKILFNNFIFLDYKQSKIYMPKHKDYSIIYGLITFKEFIKNYEGNQNNKKEYFKNKLLKHWKNFFKPIYNFKKWFSEIFSILDYLIKWSLTNDKD